MDSVDPESIPFKNAPVPLSPNFALEPELVFAPTVSQALMDTASESGKIAQKLLEGWTLLSQSCRKCSVPLLTDKPTNRIYCVSCQEFKSQEETADIDTPTAQTKFKELSIKEGGTLTQSKISNTPPERSTIEPDSIVAGTIRTMYQKINLARKELDNMNLSNSQGIIDTKNLCSLIHECAITITVLSNLKIQ